MREVYVITEVEKTVAIISCHQSEYSLKNCWAPGTHTCYPSSWGGGEGRVMVPVQPGQKLMRPPSQPIGGCSVCHPSNSDKCKVERS
jgi:hypothetical protein